MAEPTNQPDSDDGVISDELIRRTYQDLRRLAASYLGPRGDSHTLQPTAIVNEAFVRLSKSDSVAPVSRAHYFGIAAKAMRHVLADHVRAKLTDKRGGDWQRVTLSGIGTDDSTQAFDLLDVHETLGRLESRSPRQSQIVELRFFAGLTTDEIASLIGVSERTVRNEWRVARAWLRAELDHSGQDGTRSGDPR